VLCPASEGRPRYRVPDGCRLYRSQVAIRDPFIGTWLRQMRNDLRELSVGKDRGSTTQARDPGCLAHPVVDQIAVSHPAVSLVLLPATLDPVAVLADGRGEAPVEELPSRQSFHSPLPMLIW
jgi:hypothetical protein